jgi:hypothetical protein
VRKLGTIGICAVILGTASSCTTCPTTPGNAIGDRAGVRADSNTVGFGDRAGGPNYYCQPGVCQSTGLFDPDYRVCLGGAGTAANSAPNGVLPSGATAQRAASSTLGQAFFDVTIGTPAWETEPLGSLRRAYPFNSAWQL